MIPSQLTAITEIYFRKMRAVLFLEIRLIFQILGTQEFQSKFCTQFSCLSWALRARKSHLHCLITLMVLNEENRLNFFSSSFYVFIWFIFYLLHFLLQFNYCLFFAMDEILNFTTT